jgi:hypothetical protein
MLCQTLYTFSNEFQTEFTAVIIVADENASGEYMFSEHLLLDRK